MREVMTRGISRCNLGGRGRNRGDAYITSSGLGGWQGQGKHK